MKKIPLLLFCLSCLYTCMAQQDSLYAYENRLMTGDVSVLSKMAPYLDNKDTVTEFLGYHRLRAVVKNIARRIISENTLFTDAEIPADGWQNAGQWLAFLQAYRNQIHFDELTGRFVITPPGKTASAYRLRKLSAANLQRLDTVMAGRAYPAWILQDQIESFIGRKDPEALLWIASAWYRTRPRFNRYQFNDEEFLDWMGSLTHFEVGVPDEGGKMTFLYQNDYYAVARLRYLVYWINHYKDYAWDEQQRVFVNQKEKPADQSREALLFENLSSGNDSLAMQSFGQLSEADTAVVNELADAYQSNDIKRNYSLPIFPYRFLRQMVHLTQYCRDNGVPYKMSASWKPSIDSLLVDSLPYAVRYKLEERLARQLAPGDITMLEYFGLLHENNWESTYSTGRILDKCYSRNWELLIHNRQALLLYLKKSRLFDDLGIIGTCNKYLRKFENCSPETLGIIRDLLKDSIDSQARAQANEVINRYSAPVKRILDTNKINDSNFDYDLKDMERQYRKIARSGKKKDDKRWDMKQLISKIRYSQVPEMIALLRADTVLDNNDKYDFIQRDFGFSINTGDSAVRVAFLRDYAVLNEYGLYEKYLREMKIDYIGPQGQLDYTHIYEILKYDVVDAFVGGGGSRREDGVYMLIKLLELKFNTTLGYPRKLCNSMGMYGCDCTDRAGYWMQFLLDKGLVKPDVKEPVSISFNK